jgi:hypothetical protein
VSPAPLLAAVLALVLAVPAVAAAPRAKVTGMKDARYCEIFEVRALPPNGSAEIWNTIRRGSCPQSTWAKVDPAAVARQRGALAVVLNGPRHFLMDEANAVVGRRATIAGLPMTRVAAIPLVSAADIDQAPYVDRTIKRVNTWTWKKGRTVFELVRPDGAVYVMQSYSLQRDPKLTLATLPGVGRRIDLPAGWRFRVRTLKAPLVVGAKGDATILQDDLLNTYQLRAGSPRPR